MRRRITFVGALFLVIFALLFLQLNDLQIVKANSLADAPGNYSAIIKAFSTPRGAILTANGQVMAMSVPSKSQYKYQRVYPHGSLYADVTGYYSLIYGTSGLEDEYNQYLQGKLATPSSLSQLLTTSYSTDSVVTTLQSQLQQTAYQALGSLKGAVVALDPKTGAVLAMASNPTYNPAPLASASGTTEEDAWKSDLANPEQPLLNRAISRAYPPGSTFKIVTTSAIFDHDPKLARVNFPPVATIALPETTHRLHNYAYEVCGGELPVLLAVSCDTGFAQIGLRLGASNLHAEAENFGFNQVPPIDLPGAAASTFPPVSFFSQNLPQLAFSAIGQGDDQATALQMALVGSAIADDGSIMVPHLLSRIISSQDATVESYQPKVWKVATSPSTAAKVTQLMVGVVKDGTATGIALPGIEIAAKTGTAQTTLTRHSNILGQSDNWMVAFAPAQDPKIAVAVVVPKQAGLSANPTGAQYAGPIVKAMIAAALGVKL
ncbi:penicillin-binding protein 2 [Ferrimicrobium sp.]|uniref:peptidoglycan D,D-transpeptidase FtsI family protein n=1 Tax=Ferrimicrobium sp. TaxID=2926050 RepID=UPI00262B719D|nr:penicillin-binding protein 2 [Ferrimicrobium sp.]